MTAFDPRTLAGNVAAAGAVVAKQIPLRQPPIGSLTERLRPSGPDDLPRVFSDTDESTYTRVSRLSSSALLYSVNKRTPREASRTLHGEERQTLRKLHMGRRGFVDKDRSCPHCRLLHNTLYKKICEERKRLSPPIALLNHFARVNVTFDPETKISEARIDNFQLIVPKAVAEQILHFSHPLRWAYAPGTYFRQSDPVRGEEVQPSGPESPGDAIIAAWQDQADKAIFEDCVFPINEDISGSCENIIVFDDFGREEGRSINYRYRLGKCLRSNFGLAWEPSGLDVDSGFYQALAIPLKEFEDKFEDLVDFTEPERPDDIPAGVLKRIPMWKMRKRDVLELQASEHFLPAYDGVGGAGDDGAASPDPDADVKDLPVELRELYRNSWAVEGKEKDNEKAQPALASTGSFIAVQVESGTTEVVSNGPIAKASKRVGTGTDATTEAEVKAAVLNAGNRLATMWGKDVGEFYVVNVSASKRLHFTIPENSPIELWHLLTWTGPAFLFTFLNNAICLAPHMLTVDEVTRKLKPSLPKD